MKITFEKLQKFGFEFLSIFIGVFAAFALDSWNDDRKDRLTEISILKEVQQGLEQDLKDIEVNEFGHKSGIQAADFFARLVQNTPQGLDSFLLHYSSLMRGFISQQNSSGYATLKSKGLDIIQNDSLRTEIISLYENNYNALRKFEEDYAESQFYTLYSDHVDACIIPHVIFRENGLPASIKLPLVLTSIQKNQLLTDLWKIKANRKFVLSFYSETKNKIKHLQEHIQAQLKKS